MAQWKRGVELLQNNGLNALLCTQYENRRYLSGFTGSNATLLITENSRILWTDGRYKDQAPLEAADFEVRVCAYDELFAKIADAILACGVKRLGFEADSMSFATAKAYMDALPNIEFVNYSEAISFIRAIKTPEELAYIEQAAAFTDEAFEHVLRLIKPGALECEIAAEIAYYFKRRGLDTAFESIVASGPNSALPHASASKRAIQSGDFIVMDFGCRVHGYCSDMTRTVAVGRIDDTMKRIYDIVDKARKSAIEALCEGTDTYAIDDVARSLIQSAGYGESFSHGLGHGVGLAAHEPPALNHRSHNTLKAGMAVTIEPGIYINGEYGVRIEDLCVIGQNGAKKLSHAESALIVL